MHTVYVRSYRVVYALIHALTECGCHRFFFLFLFLFLLLLLLDELYAIFPAHFPCWHFPPCWQPKNLSHRFHINSPSETYALAKTTTAPAACHAMSLHTPCRAGSEGQEGQEAGEATANLQHGKASAKFPSRQIYFSIASQAT